LGGDAFFPAETEISVTGDEEILWPACNVAAELAEVTGGVVGQVERCPDVLVDPDGLVGAPDEAAAEE
jgi:hypothetical protein